MGSPVLEQAAHLANLAVPIGATVLLQSTVLLSLGLLFAHVLKRRGAVEQVLVLRGFLLAILVCPAAAILFDMAGIVSFNLPIPVQYAAPSAGLPSEESMVFLRLLDVSGAAGQSGAALWTPGEVPSPALVAHLLQQPGMDSAPMREISLLSWFYLAFMAAWAAMSLTLLARLCYSQASIRWMLFRSQTAELSIHRIGQLIARQNGARLPRIVRSARVAVPFLTGIRKPVIVLPEAVPVTFTVVVHEMGHLIRRDCFWKTICRFTMVLIPVQPLIYRYARTLDTVGEYICDDFVVSNTADPDTYARDLIAFAERGQHRVQQGIVLASTGLGQSELFRRILRILKRRHQPRLFANRRLYRGVTACCAAAILALSAVGIEGRIPALDASLLSVSAESARVVSLFPNPAVTVTGILDAVPESDRAGIPAVAREVASAVLEPSADPMSLAAADFVAVTAEPEFASTSSKTPEPSIDRGADAIPYTAVLITEPEAADSAKERIAETEPAPAARADSPAFDPGTIPVAFNDSHAMETIPVATEEEMRTISSIVARYMDTQEPSVDLASFATYEDCMAAGEQYFLEGGYFTALPLFKRALKLKPNDSRANYCIGLTYLETGDLAKAKMFFKIAIAIYPEFDVAYLRLGDTIKREGNLEEAWKQYKLAYDMNPGLTDEKKLMPWLDYGVRTF